MNTYSMHIYFLAIGGAGIGPLAQIAAQAGYQVSGSDFQNSSYIEYLKKSGITDIQITDKADVLKTLNDKNPIDWVVYSSAVAMNVRGLEQIEQAKSLGIRTSKRDEFISDFISSHNLKMIAVAGTHGKTTTVAMMVWLFIKLGLPVSYLLPAKVSFGDMGVYTTDSEYFIYEADEFDRNFLAFYPALSLISGVSYDHHEIYKTRDDYIAAFNQFISQSKKTYLWQSDDNYLKSESTSRVVLNEDDQKIEAINLKGLYNRRDALLAAKALSSIKDIDLDELVAILSDFPGLSRRMEEIVPGLYSDYAHTPEKIRGAMSAAKEIAGSKKLIIIYEPLTNRRQLHIADDYKDCFSGADKIYWLPSYLAREDPKDRIVEPAELITKLSDPSIAEATSRDDQLLTKIKDHLRDGDMVVGMAGGGGSSLDDWLRDNFN
jgi:UDP-N-acetylmuramate--alanine ligase